MEKPNNSVQSVNRTIDILESFLGVKGSVRIKDLSQKLGLHKSTIHRLLSTLERRGYVNQDQETGRYQLGLKIMDLYNSLINNIELTKVAHPVLERLAQKCRETVHLLVRDGYEAVYVDKVEFPHTIHLHSYIGKHIPLHCTASGKIFLAGLPKDEIAKIVKIKGFAYYTKNTITSEALLEEELKKIKRQGYGLDNEENEENVRCIAAPIRDSSGKVVAALSISGPTMRIKPKRVPVLIKLVREAGKEISRSMGCKQ